MNNIEILEKLKDEQYDKETLKTICVFYDEDFKPYVLSTEEREALENLIKENKELKNKCNELNFKYTAQWVDDNFIPKSKVKELLEEIKKEKNVAITKMLNEDYHLAENGAVCQTLDYIEGRIEKLLED